MAVQSYRDLRVWQSGMEIAEGVYRLCDQFPKHQQYALVSQMHRCSASIPSNLAEGHARDSTKDFLRHISIVQGSRAELETQLELAVRLEYCAGDDAIALRQKLDELGRMLTALQKSLRAKLAP